MAYNSHIHASLGTSPFNALTRRSMALPIALALPSPLTNNTPITHIIDTIVSEVFLKKRCALQLNQHRYKGRNLLRKNKLVWLYVTPTARL